MTKVAAVLFVKNEVEDIVWWLAWHFAIGFDTVFVYDDDSTDGTRELVQAAAWSVDVRCRKALPALRFNQRQNLTYMAALDEARAEFDWVIFLDADEYLDIKSGENVHDFLARYPNADGVAINWTCFGSGGHVLKPSTPNVFETYLSHSTEDLEENRIVKSFVRPKATATEYMNPHRFHVRGRYVLPSGEDVTWSDEHPERIAGRPDWSVATIRHYIVRSAEHYVRKVARRSDLREARVNIGLFVYHDTNNVFSPGLDARHWRMFQIVHSVQNSLARRALALVFPHRMTDQAVVVTASLSPGFRQWELHTGEGMQLCYDAHTGSIAQARSPEAEKNLVRLSALIVDAQPDVVYLVAAEPVVSLHLTRDCRVSSVLSFRLSHGEQGDIGLRSPHSGKAVCCLPPQSGQSVSSHVELDREAILGWEGFKFIERATPPGALALIVADIVQRQARGEDIPHYADAGEKFTADAYIATISALERTAIDAWRAAHGVPNVPWLDNAQPHTL